MDEYSDLPLLIPVSALADYCQCSICMSDMKRTTFTTCGHRFCEDCINDWINRGHNTYCPFCNAHLTTANLLKDRQFDCLIETIQAEIEKSAKKYFESLINADQSNQKQAAGGRLGNAGTQSHLPGDRLRPGVEVPTYEGGGSQSEDNLIPEEHFLTTTADHSVSPQLSRGSDCPGKSIRDMNVASSTVVNVPSRRITGSAFLPDGRLVLTDRRNDNLLLLDKDMQLTSKLKLPGQPWDVAAVGNTNVIVTLPAEEKLLYVDVSARPQIGRTINVNRKCWGVAVFGGELYVSVHDSLSGDGAVLVMDGGGKVVRRIGVDDSGRGKFQYPSYISVSAQGNVYVSDYGGGGISCYSRTGHERYHVNHSTIRQPYGILVDRDGNLLVCCDRSHDVHILKPDGALNRVLLTLRDGLQGPRSLTYRNTDDTLIVTMFSSPSVRAYKLQ